MHLVALTRFQVGRLEQELPALAPALGLSAYDARLKLAGPLPLVLRAGLDADAAHALCAQLRARGHGAIACEAAALREPAELPLVRSVRLSERALLGTDDQGRSFELACAQLVASVRAFEQNDAQQTIATQRKQLAVGRALLTGGLMLKKSVTKLETTETTERQFVAYLFGAADAPPLLLKETRINYEGLGALRGVTAHESFERLLAELRRRRPDALHDDRLVRQKRRSDRTTAQGVGNERVVSHSNASANARAAQLLVCAHAQGQL